MAVCPHNRKTYKCIDCKRVYDKEYSERTLKKYKEYITSLGCFCCGFSHPSALDVHHLSREYKRYGRSQSFVANLQDLADKKAILLCSNCHSIFHGIFGGRIYPFPLFTVEETIDTIKKERNIK